MLEQNDLDTKSVYKRMDFILKFSTKLPELFLKAAAEEKKIIITTMTNSITFDGKNIKVEQKDTFKALQNLNKTEKIAHRNTNLEPLKSQ